MTAFRISAVAPVPQAAARASAQAAAAAQAAPNVQDIGEQIRQSIQDAAQQARDAAQQVHEAQQHVREAQLRVREAAQHVRAAGTPEARREAQAALREAQTALGEAEAEARGMSHGPMVFQTGQPPMDMRNIIPPQVVDISIAFFVMCAAIIIGWPLARAFGRRIERRGDTAAVEPALSGQLQRIEQAVEAMSIEIERISESQRFMAKLQSEAGQRGALPTAERR